MYIPFQTSYCIPEFSNNLDGKKDQHCNAYCCNKQSNETEINSDKYRIFSLFSRFVFDGIILEFQIIIREIGYVQKNCRKGNRDKVMPNSSSGEFGRMANAEISFHRNGHSDKN